MSNKTKSNSIKNWSEDDQPREKLIVQGRSVLSNAELIAILIGSGSKKQSAVELAKSILSFSDNNLTQLGKLSLTDLQKFNGIGSAKAVTIAAALELGRRRKNESPTKIISITSSKKAYEAMVANLQDLDHEEFWIALLNQANHITKTIQISKGGVTSVTVDKKLICKHAIDHLASSIILYHNHPTGNLNASKQDIKITEAIKEAANIIDVQLLDHIIVGNNNYFSFKDEGLL